MRGNESLAKRLRSRDVSAEIIIVRKYFSRLFTYFRSRIKGEDNYDDLVQEVFISFFKAVRKDKITSDEYIAPFIFGIAKRVIYNYFYKKKRRENIRRKIENEHDPFIDFSGEINLQNERLIKLITLHLDKLKNIDKVILKEFYLKENSIEEISVLINRTKHYVSVRKERALKKIKNEILSAEDVFK